MPREIVATLEASALVPAASSPSVAAGRLLIAERRAPTSAETAITATQASPRHNISLGQARANRPREARSASSPGRMRRHADADDYSTPASLGLTT